MIEYRHPNVPLPPPMMVSEAGSFAYQTVVVRLPAIVRRVLADNDFPGGVVKNLEALALELPEGYVRPIGYDGGPDVAAWNSYVQPFRGQRWLDLPWFFAEAYFYRRLLEATQYFSPGSTQGVDPYEQQKHMCLETAMATIHELSAQLNARHDSAQHPEHARDRSRLLALFYSALWANRADLSMWSIITREDEGSCRVDGNHQDRILVNDAPALSEQVAGLREGRIDVIVDNAGLELICDLCMVDFLLTSRVAKTVHLHLKAHPTFVSDAMGKDVDRTIAALGACPEGEVRALATRLQRQIVSGRLQLHDDFFWTAPLTFWELPRRLRVELGRSSLVIVKGDANYRRLLGNRHWPFTTPFQEIVSYFPAPLVALRTLKAELAAGLEPAQVAAVSRDDPQWLIAGRWGVIQFANHGPAVERRRSSL